MTMVADASVVVAALVDGGRDGAWAERVLASEAIAAPHLMPAEAANILRLAARAGDISEDAAAIAYASLQALAVQLHPFDRFADRIWQLRQTVTSYDAWYVALAEELDVPLATLDGRLTRAPGPRCRFVTPAV
jgi:predicted nucleic acid-binding protein